MVFYADQGLKRSQQIFTDLNKNAVKTSNSISELYDSRDEMAVLTRNVIWNIEFLNTYTDKEKDILGKYSSSLFTLNTFLYCKQNYCRKKRRAKFRRVFTKVLEFNCKTYETVAGVAEQRNN